MADPRLDQRRGEDGRYEQFATVDDTVVEEIKQFMTSGTVPQHTAIATAHGYLHDTIAATDIFLCVSVMVFTKVIIILHGMS